MLLASGLLASGPRAVFASPPEPTITSGPASPTRHTSATFTFTDDDPAASLLCDLDGSGFAPCDSATGQDYPGPLGPGPHVFSITARDAEGGQSGILTFSWTIDVTAPQITLNSAPIDPTNADTAHFAFIADERTAFSCQLDADPAQDCAPDPSDPGSPAKGAMTYSGLSDGPHTFTVAGADAAGNTAAVQFGWTIDRTSPALSITGAPPDPTASNAATFRFEASETSAFACQLDSRTPGPPIACEPDPEDPLNPAKGSKRYTGLGDGVYTFTVSAADGAGNSSTRSFSWLIDSAPPGVVFADPSPAANAHGWNNGDVTIAFQIVDAGAGVDVAASSPSPLVLSAEGAPVTASVTAVDRAGNAASVDSPSVKIDRTPPAVTISAPSAGATFPVDYAVAALYACTDALSGVESCDGSVPSGSNVDTASTGPKTFTVNAADRAGNRITRTVNYSVIPPIPDLVQSAVSNPPPIAAPGSTFSATDTVLNQGGATAPASITRYYLSLDTVNGPADILVGARPVPSLAWGASAAGPAVTLTIPASTPLGAYYLLACADDTGVVVELDESNNCRASAATMQLTRPDLMQTSVSDPPAAAAPGSTFKVVDTVRNQGLLTAAASTTRYYLSATPQKGGGDSLLTGSRSVPSLAPGAESGGKSISVKIPATLAAGTYYLLACADDTAVIAESNEGNNCVASPATMQVTRPDLVPTAVSDPPAAVTPGGTFKVTDTVQNQGLVAAAASTTRYYLSAHPQSSSRDTLLTGSRSVPGLAPGASSAGATVTVTVPSTVALGTYFLLACADDGAAVAETDESNNCRPSATPIVVTRPDLLVTAVSNPPVAVTRGTSFKVTDTVQNQGLVPAGVSTTRYYLSTDRVRSAGDTLLSGTRSVPSLAPAAAFTGSTLSVTIPATIAATNYYLVACADDTAVVAETDEANNCHASTTQVAVGQ